MSPSSLTNPMRLLGEEDRDPPALFHHKNRYDLNSKVMLTAIISLSVVVVLVIVLHTYARCVLRRQALRRNSLRRHLGSTLAAHTVQSSSEPPKTGLLPSIIASLPIFVLTKVGDQDDATSTECAVCLSNLEEEEMARLLPNCNHTFHAECIDTWLNSHTTCPICRTAAEPRLQLEPREGPVLVASAPTAPPLERVSSVLSVSRMEGTSDAQSSSSNNKVMANNGSVSRLSSFRRMLSMDRSSRRVQSCGQDDAIADQDLERQ